MVQDFPSVTRNQIKDVFAHYGRLVKASKRFQEVSLELSDSLNELANSYDAFMSFPPMRYIIEKNYHQNDICLTIKIIKILCGFYKTMNEYLDKDYHNLLNEDFKSMQTKFNDKKMEKVLKLEEKQRKNSILLGINIEPSSIQKALYQQYISAYKFVSRKTKSLQSFEIKHFQNLSNLLLQLEEESSNNSFINQSYFNIDKSQFRFDDRSLMDDGFTPKLGEYNHHDMMNMSKINYTIFNESKLMEDTIYEKNDNTITLDDVNKDENVNILDINNLMNNNNTHQSISLANMNSMNTVINMNMNNTNKENIYSSHQMDNSILENKNGQQYERHQRSMSTPNEMSVMNDSELASRRVRAKSNSLNPNKSNYVSVHGISNVSILPRDIKHQSQFAPNQMIGDKNMPILSNLYRNSTSNITQMNKGLNQIYYNENNLNRYSVANPNTEAYLNSINTNRSNTMNTRSSTGSSAKSSISKGRSSIDTNNISDNNNIRKNSIPASLSSSSSLKSKLKNLENNDDESHLVKNLNSIINEENGDDDEVIVLTKKQIKKIMNNEIKQEQQHNNINNNNDEKNINNNNNKSKSKLNQIETLPTPQPMYSDEISTSEVIRNNFAEETPIMLANVEPEISETPISVPTENSKEKVVINNNKMNGNNLTVNSNQYLDKPESNATKVSLLRINTKRDPLQDLLNNWPKDEEFKTPIVEKKQLNKKLGNIKEYAILNSANVDSPSIKITMAPINSSKDKSKVNFEERNNEYLIIRSPIKANMTGTSEEFYDDIINVTYATTEYDNDSMVIHDPTRLIFSKYNTSGNKNNEASITVTTMESQDNSNRENSSSKEQHRNSALRNIITQDVLNDELPPTPITPLDGSVPVSNYYANNDSYRNSSYLKTNSLPRKIFKPKRGESLHTRKISYTTDTETLERLRERVKSITIAQEALNRDKNLNNINNEGEEKVGIESENTNQNKTENEIEIETETEISEIQKGDENDNVNPTIFMLNQIDNSDNSNYYSVVEGNSYISDVIETITNDYFEEISNTSTEKFEDIDNEMIDEKITNAFEKDSEIEDEKDKKDKKRQKRKRKRNK